MIIDQREAPNIMYTNDSCIKLFGLKPALELDSESLKNQQAAILQKLLFKKVDENEALDIDKGLLNQMESSVKNSDATTQSKQQIEKTKQLKTRKQIY